MLGGLLHNATKYAPQGTAISVAVAKDGDHATVRVSDEGPGVPLEQRDHIFAPLYQGGRGDEARAGLGMGLAIAQRYVDLHGGRIWVQSSDTGATFHVRLAAA